MTRPRNIIDLQRQAAIEHIDQQLTAEIKASGLTYMADIDALIDRRNHLTHLIETGPHA